MSEEERIKRGQPVKAKDGSGYVYVLSNKCFRQPWLKIGKTTTPVRRCKDLQTGVPVDFKIVATLHTNFMDRVEAAIHKALRLCFPDKCAPGKEFFLISEAEAISRLCQEAARCGELDRLIVYKNGYPAYRFGKGGMKNPIYPIGKIDELPEHSDGYTFFAKRRVFNATGYNCKGGRFVVLKDSLANAMQISFAKECQCKLRLRLEREGVIKNRRFSTHYIFKSANEAAAVVSCWVGDRNVWTTADGKEYREVIYKQEEKS